MISDKSEPERLPPPPFWRTRYFAFDVLPRRPELDPIEIRRVMSQPERQVIQPDAASDSTGTRRAWDVIFVSCYCWTVKPSTMPSRTKTSSHEEQLR